MGIGIMCKIAVLAYSVSMKSFNFILFNFMDIILDKHPQSRQKIEPFAVANNRLPYDYEIMTGNLLN